MYVNGAAVNVQFRGHEFEIIHAPMTNRIGYTVNKKDGKMQVSREFHSF